MVSCTPSLYWRMVKEYSAQPENATKREVSYLIYYDTLLQTATDIIIKCDSYFVTKCARIFITKCARIFITKCDSFITKCDVYYQLRQYISCQTVYCDSTYVRVVLHRQVSQSFTLLWKIFPNCKNKLKNQLLKVLLSKYTQSKKQSNFHV